LDNWSINSLVNCKHLYLVFQANNYLLTTNLIGESVNWSIDELHILYPVF